MVTAQEIVEDVENCNSKLEKHLRNGKVIKDERLRHLANADRSSSPLDKCILARLELENEY